MSSPILIIDICGTLYQSNTTFDFIKYHFGDTWRYRVISHLKKKQFISKLNYVWFRLTGMDIMRTELIKLLKGTDKSALLSMAIDFYNNFLLSRKNPECFTILNNYRKKGARLIIVSATLDIIAKTVAEQENINDWMASTLAYKNDICDGKLNEDLLGGKLCKLNQTLGMVEEKYDVITDNYSDVDIISQAKYAYLIQYNDKRDRWTHYLDKETLLKCEFIRI